MSDFLSQIKAMISSGLQAIAEEEDPPLHPPTPESVKEGFEIKDANVLGIVLMGFGLAIAVAATQLCMGVGFSYFKNHKMNTQASTQTPPPDFIEGSDPTRALADYRAQMSLTLNTYGWVDRERKIVHIPISEAMEKLANRSTHGN